MKFVLLSIPLLFILLGCDPGQPSDGSSNANDFKASGAAEPLEQEEFDQLSPEDQYLVANKILSMMQKGIPVDEFFDMDAGMDNLTVSNTNFINNLRSDLLFEMDPEEKNNILDEIYGVDPTTGLPDSQRSRYDFIREEDEPKLITYARIKEYPLSRDMFAVWVSHFLANTIMFSPAYEMESTDEIDITRIKAILEQSVLNATPVRDVIRQYLGNVSRWRVSRSAENHALEAYELYLGLFETEEDSRKGGIACQEWYLTDDDAGYQLNRTAFINTEPQVILEDYVITTCDELYDVVAGHPLLMLRVTEVIVNYFMDGRSSEDRLAVVESIVNSGATTFEDIFKGILFSKEFLLNTEKPISLENNLLSMIYRFRIENYDRDTGNLGTRLFHDLAGNSGSRLNLSRVGWESSEYKIGRTPNVPIDVLSFAGHHKAIREELFDDRDYWRGGPVSVTEDGETFWYNHIGLIREAYDADEEDDDPTLDDERTRTDISEFSIQEYIDYIFLTALARKATAVEIETLVDYFNGETVDGIDDLGNLVAVSATDWLDPDDDDPSILKPSSSNNYRLIAEALLEYSSRLPEFYYQKSIN